MTAALRTEWRKIITTRAWWINALVMFAYMTALAYLAAFIVYQTTAAIVG